MKITTTEIWEETITVTLESEGLMLGDTAPKIVIRVPVAGDEKASLAFHRLATLQQARDAIGAEIQRLTHIVNQNS